MAISVKRVKPSDGTCSSCLNKGKASSAVLEVHMRTYGCDFKFCVCDACMLELAAVSKKAIAQKGELVVGAGWAELEEELSEKEAARVAKLEAEKKAAEEEWPEDEEDWGDEGGDVDINDDWE